MAAHCLRLNYYMQEVVVLRGNQLAGSLPAQWSTLSKLGALSLGGNKLTGTVSMKLSGERLTCRTGMSD
jgi:hypothetical protein